MLCFLNSFTVVSLFVILCRICLKLPRGVICAVFVDNVWYSNCYLQEITPLLKNMFFIIKAFATIGTLRVLFSLSHAIVHLYQNIFRMSKVPKIHVLFFFFIIIFYLFIYTRLKTSGLNILKVIIKNTNNLPINKLC